MARTASRSSKQGFSLIEVMITIAIIAVLTSISVFIYRPWDRILQSQQQRALSELSEIAKAVQLYSLDNGAYPPDVSRDLPPGIAKYLPSEIPWPDGPFPGSVYDYDYWVGQTCTNGNPGGVQITLRQVPDRNPDGSNVWAWYYSLSGLGNPHCTNAAESTKGECVNCPGFEL